MTQKEEIDKVKELIKHIMFYALLVIFVFILIFGGFYTISAGERGVLLTFGKPDMEAKSEGLHFKIPIVQDVKVMDVKTQKYEADASAASSDLQIVTSKIATNYHLTPESIPAIYKEIGIDYQVRVIQPVEQEVVKSVTAKFTAEELITKREDVRQEMKQLFHDKLIDRGIVVEDVSIVNFDFSKSFNDAIESKVTAEQLKLKADRDLERIRVEAAQKVTQAQAEAESLRLQKMQITPELINLRQIEVQSKALDVQREAITKWNGQLPQITGGAIPFISMGLNSMNTNSSSN